MMGLGRTKQEYISASKQIKSTETALQTLIAWASGAGSGSVKLSKAAGQPVQYVVPVASGVAPVVVAVPEPGMSFPDGMYIELDNALASVSYY
jgi:hypothetical protein